MLSISKLTYFELKNISAELVVNRGVFSNSQKRKHIRKVQFYMWYITF